jgi:hypothetical protein
MFLENQRFAKMRVGQIPPSPPCKHFAFNQLQLASAQSSWKQHVKSLQTNEFTACNVGECNTLPLEGRFRLQSAIQLRPKPRDGTIQCSLNLPYRIHSIASREAIRQPTSLHEPYRVRSTSPCFSVGFAARGSERQNLIISSAPAMCSLARLARSSSSAPLPSTTLWEAFPSCHCASSRNGASIKCLLLALELR